jgi:hypothetical protein
MVSYAPEDPKWLSRVRVEAVSAAAADKAIAGGGEVIASPRETSDDRERDVSEDPFLSGTLADLESVGRPERLQARNCARRLLGRGVSL